MEPTVNVSLTETEVSLLADLIPEDSPFVSLKEKLRSHLPANTEAPADKAAVSA